MMHPHRLVSLWDMLQFSLKDFWELVEQLNELGLVFFAAEASYNHPSEDERNALLSHFNELLDHCRKFNLPVSLDTLENAIRNPPRTEREIVIITGVIQSELKSRVFLYVESTRASYFEMEVPWAAAFPDAALDMRQAGSCYAVELETACVFHSMRALEYGLHALARDIGISEARPLETQQWNTIIDQIQAAIKKKRSEPGVTSADQKIIFWSDAAAQFFIFKEAWRNHAMHIRSIYRQDQAKKIMTAVNEFMAHLAAQLNGQPGG